MKKIGIRKNWYWYSKILWPSNYLALSFVVYNRVCSLWISSRFWQNISNSYSTPKNLKSWNRNNIASSDHAVSSKAVLSCQSPKADLSQLNEIEWAVAQITSKTVTFALIFFLATMRRCFWNPSVDRRANTSRSYQLIRPRQLTTRSARCPRRTHAMHKRSFHSGVGRKH